MPRISCITLIAVFVATITWGGIPSKAYTYIPILKQSFTANWKDAPMKYISCGQIEQESNWNAKAHLNTSREQGYGLVQMTITKSFNIFREAIRMPPLKDWDWNKDKYAPDKQLTFLVLTNRSNFNVWRKYAVDDAECWKMALVSYNAGEGRVIKRREYATLKGYKKDRWTDGLELAHSPSEDRLLYDRSLWKAVNEYPVVIFNKSAKYKDLL